MKIKFIKSIPPGERITPINIIPFTGCPTNCWRRLTGLINPLLPEKFVSYNDCRVTGEYPIVRVIAKNKNIKMELRCDLELKTIHVTNFIVTNPGNGYGFLILKRMLNEAVEIGFKAIEGNARSGTDNEGVVYTGYIKWGRFGFTMDNDSHLEFRNEMKKHGREEDCLHWLLRSKEGRNFWIKNGYDWTAYFSLIENHPRKKKKGNINYRILNHYQLYRRSYRYFPAFILAISSSILSGEILLR